MLTYQIGDLKKLLNLYLELVSLTGLTILIMLKHYSFLDSRAHMIFEINFIMGFS